MTADLPREEIERLRDDFALASELEPVEVDSLLSHVESEPARIEAARQEGCRAGVEAAARWHEERAEACEAIGGRWNGQLSRDAFVAAEEHRRQAATIRALSPAPAEPRFARLAADAPAKLPAGHAAPLDTRTTRELIAERTEPSDGWIEWKGHPHRPGTLVEIETEMGYRSGPRRVEDWDWSDPLRYRIVEPSAPVAPEGDTLASLRAEVEEQARAYGGAAYFPTSTGVMLTVFRRIAALEAENAKLREGLGKAAAQFEHYRDLHLTKGSAGRDKAFANARMASMCRALLQGGPDAG